jgi:hypothetical protein
MARFVEVPGQFGVEFAQFHEDALCLGLGVTQGRLDRAAFDGLSCACLLTLSCAFQQLSFTERRCALISPQGCRR